MWETTVRSWADCRQQEVIGVSSG